MTRRSPSGRYLRWPEIIADLRAKPGRWAVRLLDQPARLDRTVKERAHPALRLDDGVIESQLVHRYRTEHGAYRGDVWLRYTPHAGVASIGDDDNPH